MIARFLLILSLFCLAAQPVSAGFVLRFESSAPVVGGVSQFQVGSNNTVNLFLVASGASDIDQATNHGVRSVFLGSPDEPYDPGVFLSGTGSITNSTPSSEFPNLVSAFTAGDAAWTATFPSDVPGFVTGETRGNEYYIHLGSLRVFSGLVTGENGRLALRRTAIEITDDDDTLYEFTVQDFNFTAVPEPSAFLLMGMAVTGGAAFLRRRKGSAPPAPGAKE
jgi:hypothetical protein